MIYGFFYELKTICMEFFHSFYQKIRYILIGAIFIFLLFSLYFFYNENNSNILIMNISIEDWQYWVTLMTLPITAIWAIHQYYKNILLRKQEKAAEIAKLFSKELLDKCSLIGNVVNNSSLGRLYKLKETDMRNLQRFDREEIIELYDDEKIFDKYKKCILSDNVQFTYLYFLEKRISKKSWDCIWKKDKEDIENIIQNTLKEHYSSEELEKLKERNLLRDEFEKYCLSNNLESMIIETYRKEYTDEEARNLFILDNKDLPFKFTKLVAEVLNELEYICMYISSQSAGSSFVYQSLHQIFLRTIKALAISIANNNKDYADKHYTNVIYVYKEWSKKMNDDKRREKNNKRKAYKYLEPKIKTV